MVLGRVYALYDNTNGNVYYGSTKLTLEDRLKKHLEDYSRYTKGNVMRHYMSAEIIDNCDYQMIELEQMEYDEDDKTPLLLRERWWIEFNPCVNKTTPLRTRKEWYDANKEKMKEYHKEYYENNKEEFAQKTKIYRDNNKEVIAEKNRKYRENNKEKLEERKQKCRAIKYTCVCGSVICRGDKSRHFKSKKHINYLAENK